MLQRLKDFFSLTLRRAERRAKLRKELEGIDWEIDHVIEENQQLRLIATQCAQQSAVHIDETRDERNAGRSSLIRHNTELLANLNRRKKQIQQQLGIAEFS